MENCNTVIVSVLGSIACCGVADAANAHSYTFRQLKVESSQPTDSVYAEAIAANGGVVGYTAEPGSTTGCLAVRTHTTTRRFRNPAPMGINRHDTIVG